MAESPKVILSFKLKAPSGVSRIHRTQSLTCRLRCSTAPESAFSSQAFPLSLRPGRPAFLSHADDSNRSSLATNYLRDPLLLLPRHPYQSLPSRTISFFPCFPISYTHIIPLEVLLEHHPKALRQNRPLDASARSLPCPYTRGNSIALDRSTRGLSSSSPPPRTASSPHPDDKPPSERPGSRLPVLATSECGNHAFYIVG